MWSTNKALMYLHILGARAAWESVPRVLWGGWADSSWGTGCLRWMRCDLTQGPSPASRVSHVWTWGLEHPAWRTPVSIRDSVCVATLMKKQHVIGYQNGGGLLFRRVRERGHGELGFVSRRVKSWAISITSLVFLHNKMPCGHFHSQNSSILVIKMPTLKSWLKKSMSKLFPPHKPTVKKTLLKLEKIGTIWTLTEFVDEIRGFLLMV